MEHPVLNDYGDMGLTTMASLAAPWAVGAVLRRWNRAPLVEYSVD
jgi:hypothetical protein